MIQTYLGATWERSYLLKLFAKLHYLVINVLKRDIIRWIEREGDWEIGRDWVNEKNQRVKVSQSMVIVCPTVKRDTVSYIIKLSSLYSNMY